MALSPVPPSAVHRRAGGNVQTLIGSEPETPPPRLDRDLAAQFDDAVRRQAEIFHRALRIAQHPGEQLFAPDRHARRLSGDQRLARQEKTGFQHLELAAAGRSEEHTSELQSIMSISYSVFC